MHLPEQAIFTNMCMVYDRDGNICLKDGAYDGEWGMKLL